MPENILIAYLEYLTIDVEDIDSKPWLAGMLTRYATQEMLARRIGLTSAQIWEATRKWLYKQ